jgi:endoglucanase
MYSLYRLMWLGGLLLCVVNANAQTPSNLVTNGTFGTSKYALGGASTFSPSTVGWGLTPDTTSTVKSQAIGISCGEFGCSGNVAYNWGCGVSNGKGDAGFLNDLQPLQANTRYRLRFLAYRDTSSLLASDPSLNESTALTVGLASGARGNFFTKDMTVKASKALVAGDLNGVAYSYDFTTPVATNDKNQSNLSYPYLYFLWKSNAVHQVCMTGVSVTEVDQSQKPMRVVANTHGYPLNGSKVASLVLPAGSSSSGLKWRLRYGSGFASYSYSVGITFYAVVVGSNGLPLKNGSGGYTLQTNGDGTPKSVGGTGTGGIGTYQNAGTLGAATIDSDTGDTIASIDFSSFGAPVSTSNGVVLDGSVVPTAYTSTVDGKSYYILSASKYNSSCRTCIGSFYIDVVDASNNILVTSKNFNVSVKPFDNLKNDALYSFYHQRSGQAIDPLFNSIGLGAERKELQHNAGHATDKAGCWANAASTKDLHGNDWGSATSSCIGFSTAVSGGWYDAADHGKYVVNGGVALWTLQNMIERLQAKNTLNSAFPSGRLSLPSTMGDGGSSLQISDLLAESRIEMEWMLKMQAPDSFFMKVPLGYQDKKLSSTADVNGVYPVDLTGQPQALTAEGAIKFGGGSLPRLRMKLNLKEVDVGGMVFHSVHDRNWTGIPLNPSLDTQERVLMYPTTAATLNFAAVAAQCSRIWRSEDPIFADRCFSAATKAWSKAKQFRVGFTDIKGNVIAPNSDIFRYEYSNQNWTSADPSSRNSLILQNGFAINPLFGGGGAYGDLRVGDEFYWAGAELYLATAARGTVDISYHTYGKAQGVLTTTDKNGQWSKCEQTIEPVQCYSWINGFDWQNTSAMGTMSLLTYSSGSLASTTARSNLFAFADTLVTQSNAQGYKFAKQVFDAKNRDTHYEWGANGGVLNRAMILGMAADLQTDAVKKANYLAAVVNSMGYLLGRNTMEKSFISGYGNNAMSNPHHRWFAKHADSEYPRVPAGFISGGPNTRDIPALRANAPRYEKQADVNYALVNGDPSAKLGGIADASQRYFDANVVASCMNEGATLAPTYVPQKCYADHYRSFATNEVAINWQAPLVWVAQFLSENY